MHACVSYSIVYICACVNVLVFLFIQYVYYVCVYLCMLTVHMCVLIDASGVFLCSCGCLFSFSV